MKKTALTDTHIDLGAKMVEFAGYQMPIQYSGIREEHEAVRKAVGVFDVSHMGEFILKGERALDLIQRTCSNDASKLTDGKAQYSCMPNETGGIIDDLIVYRIDEKTYMLVVNASNIQKDWDWLQKHNTDNVEMHDISEKTTLLAVQGPKAKETLQPLTPVNLDDIPYYHFAKGELAGCDNVLISNTGYTGSGGFEVYFENRHATVIWDAVMKSGQASGIRPCGLAARDTLRLEMGFCLYGNDIDDTTSPLEAGLGWITRFTKPFTNSENLKAQKEAGVTRRLAGFVMLDKGIPRKGYPITDAEGKAIGEVTSGTQSPSLGVAIGMGYIPREMAVAGTDIHISIRNKLLKASIVKTPFDKPA